MAYLRYSTHSKWYVLASDVDSGAEPQLAIWHRDHRVSEPVFTLSSVRTMIQSNDLPEIPGYESSDHDLLLKALDEFVDDEDRVALEPHE